MRRQISILLLFCILLTGLRAAAEEGSIAPAGEGNIAPVGELSAPGYDEDEAIISDEKGNIGEPAEAGTITPGGEGSFFYNNTGFINSETYHGEVYYDSNESFIEVIGEIAREDMKCSGILASVTVAQAILESGFGTSKLATEGHNLFGIKASLSGNNWENSTWDGVSTFRARTAEQTKSGVEYYITADFRAYESIVDSVGDHSAYLIGAVNGDHYRYDGLQYQTDYRTAAQIIKSGGYATDVKYVDKLCNLIETYDLTRFDEE